MAGRVYRLTVSYDGTRYRGWQRLPDTDLTVQGKIEAALREIFAQNIEISGSGRTDAGVHATGQVASFRAPERPTAQVLAELCRLLPADIGAEALDFASDRFHARLCATEKTYTYFIWNSAAPDIFGRRYRLQLPQELDISAMQRGAELLAGTHDFLAFCSNKHYKKSSVRTVKRIELHRDGNLLQIRMTADGFLYNMARILVGTLLEIGQRKRNAEDIAAIFESRKRENAGETAPAKGLFLTEVRYD